MNVPDFKTHEEFCELMGIVPIQTQEEYDKDAAAYYKLWNAWGRDYSNTPKANATYKEYSRVSNRLAEAWERFPYHGPLPRESSRKFRKW